MVNPLGFSIISMAGTRGKRGGDFLFKADQREAALWLPFSPSRRSDFSFCFFFLLEVALHDRKLQRML